jgi:hypothetical protein
MIDGKIIRAGFTSNAYMAGNAQVMIQGTFSKEDIEDLMQQLEIVIRSVKRQAAEVQP